MLSFQLKEKESFWSCPTSAKAPPSTREVWPPRWSGRSKPIFSHKMWFAKLVWSRAGWIPPLLGSEIKTVIHSQKVPNSLAASGVAAPWPQLPSPSAQRRPLPGLCTPPPAFLLKWVSRETSSPGRRTREARRNWLSHSSFFLPYVGHSDFSNSSMWAFFSASPFPLNPVFIPKM